MAHFSPVIFFYFFFNLITPGQTADNNCANVTISEYDIGRLIFPPNETVTSPNIWQRPVRNALKPIQIRIRLVLSSINDVMEKYGTIKLNGYLAMTWDDEYKIWNTTFPYMCLSYVTVNSDQVWLPDVAVINAENHYDLLISKHAERVRIYSNGTHYYLPGGTFMFYCQFYLRWFPFDENNCTMQLEGWRLPVSRQRFALAAPATSTAYWRENEQWHMTLLAGSVSSATYFTGDPYAQMIFWIKIRRKIGYYMTNIVVPSVIISVAQLSVFSLPVDEVIKIHVCFTCLLAYGVFQLMIIEDMPRASDNIPLLSIYIDLSMAYIAASMIGEAAVFLSLRRAESQNPQRMSRFLFYFGELLSVPLQIPRPSGGQNNTSSQPDSLHIHYRFYGKPLLPGGDDGDVNNKRRYGRRSAVWDINKNEDGFQSDDDSRDNNNNVNKDHQQLHYGAFMPSRYPSPFFPNNNSSKQNVNNGVIAANYRKNQDDKTNDNIIRKEWQFLARVIDRFTFVCYLLLIIATPVGMFGILPVVSDD